LERCNGEKSSNGAVFGAVLLATMKAQQAVAIRFVGRRVMFSTCLFFALADRTTRAARAVERGDGHAVLSSPTRAL
jgi:hypothetical protein